MNNVTVTQKVITPQMAEEMLKMNTRNRPMNEGHVKALIKELQGGRWKINGDTICVSGNLLVDGQHRLEACRRSGVPLTTLVVEGVGGDVFDTKDCGRRRNAADSLALLGEKNAFKLAASLAVVDRYMTGRMNAFVRYTNADIEHLLSKYPGVRESVTKCGSGAIGLVPFSIFAGLHYLFALKDSELADLVMNKIAKGAELVEGEPIYVLRERLMRNSLSKSKLGGTYIAALMIKAWNATRSGNRVHSLRYTESGDTVESFPTIK